MFLCSAEQRSDAVTLTTDKVSLMPWYAADMKPFLMVVHLVFLAIKAAYTVHVVLFFIINNTKLITLQENFVGKNVPFNTELHVLQRNKY